MPSYRASSSREKYGNNKCEEYHNSMSTKIQYAIQVILIIGSLIAAFIFVTIADVEGSARSQILLCGVTTGAILAALFNFIVHRKRKKDHNEKRTHH